MKRLLAVLIVGLVLVTGYAQTPEPKAKEPVDSQVDELLQKSEDEILAEVAKLPDEQIDLGLIALVLAKGFYPDIDIKKYLKQLDEMADEIKQLIGDEKDPEKIIQTINNYLFETKGLTAVNSLLSEGVERDFLLDFVINSMKGNCLGLTTLYLALGERLKIPLYGIEFPDHLLVRYDDGKFKRNIEPTKEGQNLSKQETIEWIREIVKKNIERIKGAELDWEIKDRFYATYDTLMMTPADLDKGGYFVSVQKKDVIVYIIINRGCVYVSKNKKEKATEDAEKAVALSPNSPHLWAITGELYARIGDQDKALRYIDKTINLAPDFFMFYEERGGIYINRGELNKALADYNKAIKLNPNCAEVYHSRGATYYRMREYDKALKDFDKAIELAPVYFQPHFGRATILYKKKEYDKSLESMKKVIELEPSYPQSYYVKGLIYQETKELPEVIKAFKKYIEFKPNSAETYYRLAFAYGKLDDYKKAIESYKEAIRLKPDYTKAHYGLGYAYRKLDDYKKAIESYKEAIRLKPDYTNAHYALGLAYHKTGNRDSALEEYKILKDLDKEWAEKLLGLINKEQDKGAKPSGDVLDEPDLSVMVFDMIDYYKISVTVKGSKESVKFSTPKAFQEWLSKQDIKSGSYSLIAMYIEFDSEDPLNEIKVRYIKLDSGDARDEDGKYGGVILSELEKIIEEQGFTLQR